jgi:hypothetical protein
MSKARAVAKYTIASSLVGLYGAALYRRFTEEEPAPPASKEKFVKVAGAFIAATLLITFF